MAETNSVVIVKNNFPNLDENGNFYLHDYPPYWIDKSAGIKNPSITCHSRLIMDFKSKIDAASKRGHNTFFQTLNPYITTGVPIVIVPSHDPENRVSNLVKLGKSLANTGRIDATSCLRRVIKVEKLSEGGDRSIDVHLNSIQVENEYLIKKFHVLLLDDVTTTGNSFNACKRLLLQAGATKVTCLALGKTKR